MSADTKILRDLARRVREIADDPEMAVRRARWASFNQLRPQRPMVLCFPEGAWRELLPQESMLCKDAQLREWEWKLRSQIYWWEHFRDDNFIEPFFDIGWRVSVGDFGFDVPFTHGDHGGSYVWDAQMKDLDKDFGKLHFRPLGLDREKTLEDMRLAGDIFGEFLPPRIHSFLWWSTGLTWDAAKLVGLEKLMWAMCDQPAELHRLMAFLRDDMLRFVRWCEDEGLLTANDGADYVGSGGVGCLREHGATDAGVVAPSKLSDRWGFAESQETVGVSPGMFEEFILPYQIPLLEKTALNCYGCCEGLEHRIDLILKHVPRLRRISVAPSADQESIAPNIVGKYIYSRKPYPAHVCVGFNEQAIRDDLRRTLRLARGGPLEFILKDTHGLEGEPWRLGQWVKIAREEIEHAA
jgi:hypothetical protein